MKLQIRHVFILLFNLSFLFSCARADKTEKVNFFENLYRKLPPFKDVKSLHLTGVWMNTWFNQDGYRITEFIVLNPETQHSYACVLNSMGGYEYSLIQSEQDKFIFSLIDPDKKTYINQLSEYGRDAFTVKLKYEPTFEQLRWANIPAQESSNRVYVYNKITSSQAEWNLFQSTCAKFLRPAETINPTQIFTEQLVYEQDDSFVEILQSSDKNASDGNFCIFNVDAKTVLSLPVKFFSNRSIVFSTLDIMSSKDRSKIFKQIPAKEILKRVPSSFLTLCSVPKSQLYSINSSETTDPFYLEKRVSDGDTNDLDPSEIYSPFDTQSVQMMTENALEGKPTYTYLVCEYHNLLNGSNGGWEWGEYPRWEWEKQTTSCSGIFSSNCVRLNGAWARDDRGIGAIGTMFVMDTSSHLEADISRVCNTTNDFSNRQDARAYVQYYVADSFTSLNHTIWFKKTRNDAFYQLPFNRVVAFGDSLSDNGNLYTATAGLVGKGNYYHGRFSNGPVWVEYFSKYLGLDLYNWAVAAAPSDFGNFFDLFKSVPYTLQHELSNFTDSIHEVGMTKDEIEHMLFTLLIGGNNFVHDIKSTPEEIADDYANFADALVSLGAKYIMIINLPDLAIAPRYNKDDENAYVVRKRVQLTNELIENKIRMYQIQHPAVTFYDVNLFKYTDDAMLNPSKYYLTNTTDRCYTGSFYESYNSEKICDNPQTYLFWDDLHPSTTFGCQTAGIAINMIFEKHKLPQIPIDYRACVMSFITN